ncbi:DUF397 domain-containing protein [Nocardia macrotermitis]|uniref:DUF397 domain-containing protein n=1 Tax=Nocardia macrotermitis TaxID=2585198 RepID=A0A7K0DAU0_9NOCA|nr:DUF397 domain-containing protein [Nocardia macrotermitis]MQY22903.1 hypothetical protein [Nocardia macrotermitis]
MYTAWFKSTHSGSEHTCVEIAHRAEAVHIRDSKYVGPSDDQPIVSIAPDLWSAFLHLVLSATSASLDDTVSIALHPAGGATIVGGSTALVYTAAEWDAFTKGVADGQFDRVR